MFLPVTPRGTTRLERKALATTYQVDDLLAEARTGRLRLPHFQRGMKWQDKDRIDLLDSLYRGFPIGTLLFWQRRVERAEVQWGDLKLEAPARQDGFLIVDGQQRVTTLVSTLLVPHAPGDRAILFDLERDEFRYGRIREPKQWVVPEVEPEPHEIPAYVLFDSSRLIQWVAASARAVPKALIERALDCGKRLREYRIPVYIVDTDDEDMLRVIFDRTNRTGRRLDDTDVFPRASTAQSSPIAPLALARLARRRLARSSGEPTAIHRCDQERRKHVRAEPFASRRGRGVADTALV